MPKFSGAAENLPTHIRNIKNWAVMANIPDNMLGRSFVQSLPPKDIEFFLSTVGSHDFVMDKVVEMVKRRYACNASHVGRARWKALRCRGQEIGDYQRFFQEWCLLKAEVVTSREEEKEVFLSALPPTIQDIAIKHQDRGVEEMDRAVVEKLFQRDQLRSLKDGLKGGEKAKVNRVEDKKHERGRSKGRNHNSNHNSNHSSSKTPRKSPITPSTRCFRCGVAGHYKSACRESEDVKCTRCQRSGHLKEACDLAEQWRARSPRASSNSRRGDGSETGKTNGAKKNEKGPK